MSPEPLLPEAHAIVQAVALAFAAVFGLTLLALAL